MPQFLRNCGRGNRGRPAGRLSFFLGCARGATGLDFALCGGRPKALPLESASLLKKAGPKTWFVLAGRFYESHGLLKSSPRSLSRGQ